MTNNEPRVPSLRWDCANAVMGCDWSREFIPVAGWTATRRDLHIAVGHATESYIVHDCPAFARDATGGGQKWWQDGEPVTRSKMRGRKPFGGEEVDD